MTTLYWTFPFNDTFGDKNNWVDDKQAHPSAPPGAGDDIIVDIGGAGDLNGAGASVGNVFLSGERIIGGL